MYRGATMIHPRCGVIIGIRGIGTTIRGTFIFIHLYYLQCQVFFCHFYYLTRTASDLSGPHFTFTTLMATLFPILHIYNLQHR